MEEGELDIELDQLYGYRGKAEAETLDNEFYELVKEFRSQLKTVVDSIFEFDRNPESPNPATKESLTLTAAVLSVIVKYQYKIYKQEEALNLNDLNKSRIKANYHIFSEIEKGNSIEQRREEYIKALHLAAKFFSYNYQDHLRGENKRQDIEALDDLFFLAFNNYIISVVELLRYYHEENKAQQDINQ